MPIGDTDRILRTATAPQVIKCESDGADHDWQMYAYTQYGGRQYVSYVCLWCDAVACGNPDQLDPCMRPYHHTDDHRARSGERWPIGGSRREREEPSL